MIRWKTSVELWEGCERWKVVLDKVVFNRRKDDILIDKVETGLVRILRNALRHIFGAQSALEEFVTI